MQESTTSPVYYVDYVDTVCSAKYYSLLLRQYKNINQAKTISEGYVLNLWTFNLMLVAATVNCIFLASFAKRHLYLHNDVKRS